MAGMELRHLRYFVAVAEEGSLTVAAQKRLHTAQPSLSRQIHDLELELGVQLLIRGPRGIELTASGRVFLDHAAGLIRGKIDLAFLRPEKQAPGLKFRLLRRDPLVVLMPHDHALAVRTSIRPQDIAGERYIGVSAIRAPTLRAVIEDYAKRTGIALKPEHQAENLAMAISLVASTGGVCLLPLYAQNLLPKTVVSRPIQGAPPMVDLVVGYNEANKSPLLKFLLSKVDELKFRVSKHA